MKSLALCAALLVVVGSQSLVAQSATPPDRGRLVSAAREVMKQARYCTLVTVGDDGQPQARIVDPSEPDADFTVWVGTNTLTRKVAQLRKNPQVTLLYFDKATLSYVTLLGSGTLVADPVEKEKHWQTKWAPFFRDGSKSPNLVFIRFKPDKLEIVSAPHKLANDPQTWRPVTLDLK